MQRLNESTPVEYSEHLNDRFEVDDQKAWSHLADNGYVVIANVLESADRVAEAKGLFWDYLEDAANNADPRTQEKQWWKEAPVLDRDDVTTWDSRRWVADASTGLINTAAIGQSKFSWMLRGLPKVQQAFQHCWADEDEVNNADANASVNGTTDVDGAADAAGRVTAGGKGGGGKAGCSLITSFDGGNAFRPFGLDAEAAAGTAAGTAAGMAAWRGGWKTSGGWYHVDQGPSNRGKCCVQGLVTLTDATQHTGGLTVIPRSHNKHDLLFAKRSGINGGGGGDFVRVDRFDTRLGLEAPILVAAKAGDLLLWDSRTVHCNTPALVEGNPVQSQPSLLRVAAYICMMPRWLPAAYAKGGNATNGGGDAAAAIDNVDAVSDAGNGCGSGGGESTLAKNRRDAVNTGKTTTHWPYAHRVTSAPPVSYDAFASCVGSVANLTPLQLKVL